MHGCTTPAAMNNGRRTVGVLVFGAACFYVPSAMLAQRHAVIPCHDLCWGLYFGSTPAPRIPVTTIGLLLCIISKGFLYIYIHTYVSLHSCHYHPGFSGVGLQPIFTYIYCIPVAAMQVDEVEFLVPRLRSNGQAIWQRGTLPPPRPGANCCWKHDLSIG